MASFLKGLQIDIHMVQKINYRTTWHPPIIVQYSNKDLKKPFLISSVDFYSSSKFLRFSFFLQMVHMNVCSMMSDFASPWSSKYFICFGIIYITPEAVNAKDHDIWAIWMGVVKSDVNYVGKEDWLK